MYNDVVSFRQLACGNVGSKRDTDGNTDGKSHRSGTGVIRRRARDRCDIESRSTIAAEQRDI
jgi:hypothetical protein